MLPSLKYDEPDPVPELFEFFFVIDYFPTKDGLDAVQFESMPAEARFFI